MAAAVDSVVPFLLQNLSQLLVDEVKLLSGVEDKIESLRNELRFIDIFLKSSEGRRSNEIVKEVVNQIRDVALKAENVVDIYITEATIQRKRNILNKLVNCTSHTIMLHDVDAEIEKLKRSIEEIYKNRERYDIVEGQFKRQDNGSEEGSLRKIRRDDVEEEDVVGLVNDSRSVIKQIAETGTTHLDVVSIIGMGGLGKTTLARKTYNSEDVKDLFPCRAWGSVSDDYRASELLLSLLKCLLSASSEYTDLFKRRDDGVVVSEDEEAMKRIVKERLSGKRYLVVLDDMWETRVWDELQGAFPDDNNGSRILITSRNRAVASYTGTATTPYDLPFLNQEESRELFFKKVFRGGGGRDSCPPDLVQLGESIAESCGGLPLAIVVLAGLARKNKSANEWKRIKDYVNWSLAQEDSNRVMDILRLSYDNLPQRLKPCFLYFGIYPEDYEIQVRELIQMWMAEGFLHTSESGTSDAPEPEDIGDFYLNELVNRNLVQVTGRTSYGGAKTCQIHDLLRDLCISESKANKFMEVCKELDRCDPPRRMSVHLKQFSFSPPDIYNNQYQSHTRSLFLFGEGISVGKESKGSKGFMKHFKLARLLHLNGVFWRFSPGGLKTMIHLRYLKIQKMSGSGGKIASSICQLSNLETLNVCCFGIWNIASGIWKLKRLRHFNLRAFISFFMERGSETMQNLLTLSSVPICPALAYMLHKDRFPKLKKLGLEFQPFKTEHSHTSNLLLISLHHLSQLHTLKIRGRDLIRLDANVIKPNFFPPNVTKITLKCFKGLDSKILGGLPNLGILKLLEVGERGCLDCADGEFPKLQVFEMDQVGFQIWRLEKGAMPCLSRLVIRYPSLEELPEQLWSLTTLQQVHVTGQSSKRGESLYKSLQDAELNNGFKPTLTWTEKIVSDY